MSLIIKGATFGITADINMSVSLETPLMNEADVYCHIIVKIPVATNSHNHFFKGNVAIVGYFE